MLRRVFDYIQDHFFLRNVTIAICLIIVVTYLISVVLNIYTRHGQKYSVPDLAGCTVSEAAPLLEEANLKLEVIDSLYVPDRRPGEILDQSPDAEMRVKSGRNVFVVINAERPRMEVVPYVAGYSLRQAKNMLETRGFTIRKLRYVDDVATNNVLGQYIDGRAISTESQIMAELGSSVDLVVGQNPSSPLPNVPKVIGLTQREAQSRLWEIGLNLGTTIPDNTCTKENMSSARVWKQIPNQRERAMFGTTVTLYLTTDPALVASGSKASDEKSMQPQVVDSMEMADE